MHKTLSVMNWVKIMARPFLPPSPKDRSVNEPSTIVSATQVLGLYNQENPADKKKIVVDKVKDWYIDYMENEQEWHKAEFHGNQWLLTANVELAKKSKK